MKNPTEQEIQEYSDKLIAKFKLDPQYELIQEYGRMLMKHIDELTPTEYNRYLELKELLKHKVT